MRMGKGTFKGNARQQLQAQFQTLMSEALLSRRDLLNRLMDPRRDLDAECGYPADITIADYRSTYERVGLGKRIVELFPNECWKRDPSIYETEDGDETAFELAWDALDKERNVLHYLHRVDVVSGIGCFGVLLLGLSDGGKLHEPVPGINERGEPSATPKGGKAPTKNAKPLQLLYLRAFDESVVTVDTLETDPKNPRYGQPTVYSITFEDRTKSTISSKTVKVHWTRVIHVADNRDLSEVRGTPRLKAPYNRIRDVVKILGGAGEMFWKGGFPGYVFEVDPDKANDTEVDMDDLKDQIEDWQNGLQRFLSFVGVSAKSLAPQVADPTAHYDACLVDISITIGVPSRVLQGSEEAKLASTQDKKSWNERLEHRQTRYLSPMVVRPFVDRLIAIGVLPTPAEGYTILWPDLNAATDAERATVAKTWTEALALYVSSGAEAVMPPEQWLTHVWLMDPDEVKSVLKAMEEHVLTNPPEETAPVPDPSAPADEQVAPVEEPPASPAQPKAKRSKAGK